LKCEDTDAASSLRKNVVSSLDNLETVQGVPGSQTSTAECGSLDVAQVLGLVYDAIFVKGAVLPESSVNDTAEAGLKRVVVERASNVTLVEESYNLVALLKQGNLGADGHDGAGAV